MLALQEATQKSENYVYFLLHDNSDYVVLIRSWVKMVWINH